MLPEAVFCGNFYAFKIVKITANTFLKMRKRQIIKDASCMDPAVWVYPLRPGFKEAFYV